MTLVAVSACDVDAVVPPEPVPPHRRAARPPAAAAPDSRARSRVSRVSSSRTGTRPAPSWSRSRTATSPPTGRSPPTGTAAPRTASASSRSRVPPSTASCGRASPPLFEADRAARRDGLPPYAGGAADEDYAELSNREVMALAELRVQRRGVPPGARGSDRRAPVHRPARRPRPRALRLSHPLRRRLGQREAWSAAFPPVEVPRRDRARDADAAGPARRREPDHRGVAPPAPSPTSPRTASGAPTLSRRWTTCADWRRWPRCRSPPKPQTYDDEASAGRTSIRLSVRRSRRRRQRLTAPTPPAVRGRRRHDAARSARLGGRRADRPRRAAGVARDRGRADVRTATPTDGRGRLAGGLRVARGGRRRRTTSRISTAPQSRTRRTSIASWPRDAAGNLARDFTIRRWGLAMRNFHFLRTPIRGDHQSRVLGDRAERGGARRRSESRRPVSPDAGGLLRHRARPSRRYRSRRSGRGRCASCPRRRPAIRRPRDVTPAALRRLAGDRRPGAADGARHAGLRAGVRRSRPARRPPPGNGPLLPRPPHRGLSLHDAGRGAARRHSSSTARPSTRPTRSSTRSSSSRSWPVAPASPASRTPTTRSLDTALTPMPAVVLGAEDERSALRVTIASVSERAGDARLVDAQPRLRRPPRRAARAARDWRTRATTPHTPATRRSRPGRCSSPRRSRPMRPTTTSTCPFAPRSRRRVPTASRTGASTFGGHRRRARRSARIPSGRIRSTACAGGATSADPLSRCGSRSPATSTCRSPTARTSSSRSRARSTRTTCSPARTSRSASCSGARRSGSRRRP